VFVAGVAVVVAGVAVVVARLFICVGIDLRQLVRNDNLLHMHKCLCMYVCIYESMSRSYLLVFMNKNSPET